MNERQFGLRAESLRPALTSLARRKAGNDAEEVAQDTITAAWEAIDFYNEDTGEAGFALWLKSILQTKLSEWRRSSHRDAPLETVNEVRWAALATMGGAEKLSDTELAHEARWRMRFAILTEPQSRYLSLLLSGKTHAEIARVCAVPRSTVSYHIGQASQRLRQCPCEWFAQADRDWQFFGLSLNNVTIYHRPTTQGSKLSNEKMRRLK